MKSLGRGNRREAPEESEVLKSSISKYFSNIVTGPYKQDVSCLLVGNKGTGKSYTSLSIAYLTSVEIASIIGGKPSDYFDIDHVACIDPTAASDLIKHYSKNNIYVFDDIGIGWNSRKWNSSENVEKNDIFQINRLDSAVQLFSCPSGMLLDKVPRSLVSHYAETDRQFYSKGLTTIKLFKPRTLFRENNKIIQPFISTAGCKFVLYAIPKPPQSLCDEYDILRKKATKQAMVERIEGKEDTGVIPAAELRTINMHKKIAEVLPEFVRMKESGMKKSDILPILKISPSTWGYWYRSGLVPLK
jgi:ABC-type dipeptide/oligopeptide/nickel transport system ATPase component